MRILLLTRELLSILSLFEGEGIEVIPLKGLLLAENAYGGATLRSPDDLDLLIRREAISKARDVLIARDYRPHVLSFLYFFVRPIRVVRSQGAGPAKQLWRVLSGTFRSS